MNRHQLIQAADRCVLCALCSSHCPTYQLHREEGESPRGRVMLSAALFRGELKPSPTLIAHINHCLLCRACEKACPSEVPYSTIIDHARDLLPHPTGAARLLEWLSRHPGVVQGIATTARQWKRLKLPLPAIGEAATQPLTRSTAQLEPYYPAKREPIGRVGLFLGCITRPFDIETHHAAIKLLTQLGYEVFIPREQQCCGALAQHHGNPDQAIQHAAANQNAFGTTAVDAILFSSSGCGVQLIEQGQLDTPCIEICNFITQSPTLKQLMFKPLKHHTALHHPCSLNNVLNGSSAVEKLLQQLPSLTITPLGPDQRCCGAAGSHQLQEPETAAALRHPKLEALQQSRASLLLTTNYGCALHLAEGLLKTGNPVETLHPVTLLARQLDESAPNR